ncbi:MAG TPA: hypothetical protein VKZ87_05215 [Ferrovibrio sp.]|jgi:hypothetical protein|uniref:hypothetical protein n=1 Tax=Ferrovibrio sp. TaxID=1917215 RepID=UPI002B4B4BDE|nr:hypothetical protein [Ferrovibrio sp.]HLT76767.1 hypothetical protein [Ferrovibrio sp.]
MTFADAFILVLPALAVLLAAGWLSGYIENVAYRMHGAQGLGDSGLKPAEIEGEYNEARRQMGLLRERRTELESDLADLHKERAFLASQEQAMADLHKNFVAEAGYPVNGQQGFYFKMDGRAAAMPFAGLASMQMAIGGRRQVRLIVWGMGPAEARNFATSWAGEGASLTLMRPFEGRLFWHEA